ELHHPFTAFALIPFRPDAVELLGDLASHRHRRIERALRLRADIGDVAAGADFADPRLENVMAGEGNLAGTIFEAFRQPVSQRPAEDGLACATLAVDPENIRRVQAKADAIEDGRGPRPHRTHGE